MYESLAVCDVTGQFSVIIDDCIDSTDDLRCR